MVARIRRASPIFFLEVLRRGNELQPEVNKGAFTAEEEAVIVLKHREVGNSWSSIASCLPGRTDNFVKNYWNSPTMGLKRRVVDGSVFKANDHLAQGTSLEDLLSSLPGSLALRPSNPSNSSPASAGKRTQGTKRKWGCTRSRSARTPRSSWPTPLRLDPPPPPPAGTSGADVRPEAGTPCPALQVTGGQSLEGNPTDDKGLLKQLPLWTPTMDTELVASVELVWSGPDEPLDWGKVASVGSLLENGFTGIQCRDRWHSQLHLQVVAGQLTPREKAILVLLHREHRGNWAKISQEMPSQPLAMLASTWLQLCKTGFETERSSNLFLRDNIPLDELLACEGALETRRLQQLAGPSSEDERGEKVVSPRRKGIQEDAAAAQPHSTSGHSPGTGPP